MKSFLLNIILFLTLSPLQGSFYEANEAFGKGHYRDAIQQWEALHEKSFAKYFNLGCAYEKLGEPIDAWVAWERAKQIAPYDKNLKSALASLPLTDTQKHFIPFYQTKFCANVIFVVFLVLFWGLFFVALRQKSKIATFLLILLSVGMFSYQMNFDLSKRCVVFHDNASLRISPTTQAIALRTLPKGTPLISTQQQGHFVSVHSGSDYHGWIALDDLEYILES